MSEQTQRPKDCALFEQIVLDEAEGALTVADLEFKASHLPTCARCRNEQALLEDLRFNGTAPAAQPLDDLSRRRVIRDIVSTARQRAPRKGSARTAAAQATTRSWMVVAAGLAACLVVGLGFAIWPRGPKTRRPSKLRTVPQAEVPARVLLASGEARLNGAPLQIKQVVPVGQRLELLAGRAALRLPMGSTVLVRDRSVLALERLDDRRVVVKLERGELLASVTRRKAQQVFQVVTPSGRILVKGTAFAVHATARFTEVRVIRGVVWVEAPGRATQTIRAGFGTVIGTPPSSVKTSGWLASLQEAHSTKLLELLPHPETSAPATIRLRTSPPGATVLVNGTTVGVTPLATELEPGHRRLVLRRKGFADVEELLALRAGDSVTRDFKLTPKPKPVTASLAPKKPVIVAPRAPVPSGPVVAPPKAPTARALLERAQKARTARSWQAAAAAYRELIRRYPQSSEGRAALVSLGIVLLGPLGNARGALRLFDRYLALTRAGDLAQEASYGRARALRRLGRKTVERAALREFIKRYPAALQAPRAKLRLRKLNAPPPGTPPPGTPAPGTQIK